jgi:hypothetical protein
MPTRGPHQVSIIGIPWYRREDWPQIKAMMADAHKLHATFDQWLKAAEQLAAQLSAQGVTVIKALIEPEPFRAWCRTRGLNVDANARNEFAAERAAAHKNMN